MNPCSQNSSLTKYAVILEKSVSTHIHDWINYGWCQTSRRWTPEPSPNPTSNQNTPKGGSGFAISHTTKSNTVHAISKTKRRTTSPLHQDRYIWTPCTCEVHSDQSWELQIPRNWICPSYRGTHSTGTKLQTNRGQNPQLKVINDR